MKNIFCKGLLSLTFSLVAATTSFAQNISLKIGDALPESIWTTSFDTVNAPDNTTTLSNDKNKLIIIDFWATWCSSCLLNFPKMEELQKQFRDQLSIIAVSDQSRTVLEKFFSSANGKRYAKTLSVANDKLLHNFFPHKGIPYVIWIKDGKVINITDAEQVTEKSISEILRNQKSSLQTVIQIDKTRPLMLSESYDAEKSAELISYSFISKGRIRSLDYGTWFHREKDKTFGRQFTNLSLMEIYNALAYELFELRGDHFSEKRKINKLRDPKEIDFKTTIAGKETDSKLYNVDFIVPKTQSDSLYNKMIRFINENTPYDATIEMVMTKCLVLKRISDKDKIATKGGAFVDRFFKEPSELQNVPLQYLLSSLNANNSLTALPVIDETGYKGKVDLHFSTVNNFQSFQKELAGYDLTLEESERPILTLTLKDKQP